MDTDTEEDPTAEKTQLRLNGGNPSFIKKTRSRLVRLLNFGTHSTLEEDVAELIEEHDPEGTQVGSEERSILNNVLSLSDTTVSDVMVPRADIVAVDYNSNLNDLINLIIEKEHTRIPVYKDSLDNIIGFIHIKDLVSFLGAAEKENFAIKDILREVLFVPPSMKIIDLLPKIQSKRVHLAIVLDEYGCTDGLVTLEDLVEEIIGEIEDEHDEENSVEIKQIDASSYEVNARMSVEDLEKKLDVIIIGEDESEDFDTLGGLVIYLLGHVPEKGEIVKHTCGIEFEVLEADARKVSKLIVRRL